MFGMVVLFGLFHGLIFLPVMLSLIGPQSQTSIDLSSRNIAKEEDTFDNQEAKHLSIESPNHWQVLHVQHTAKNDLTLGHLKSRPIDSSWPRARQQTFPSPTLTASNFEALLSTDLIFTELKNFNILKLIQNSRD